MTTNPSDRLDQHESRLDRIERALENFSTAIAMEREQRLQDILPLNLTVAETALNISDLRSTVSTLADLITIQQQEVSELGSTVSTLADLVTIQQQEAERDRSEARAERERAAADRALMLQLIQAIAQGRNGG